MEGPEGKPGLADENKRLRETITKYREVIDQLLNRIRELEGQDVPKPDWYANASNRPMDGLFGRYCT